MIDLLFNTNGLSFKNVYIYSILFQSISEILSEIGFTKLPKSFSVFVFDDDVAIRKQNVMHNYFSMDSHASIDTFYICQIYSKIRK